MTITVADLTQATLEGTGVFDVLMRANKAHLESEFVKNRIKGPEYSTVYLGSLNQVLQTALQFLLTKEKTALEAQLLEQQIILAQVEVQKANAQLSQIQAQTDLLVQQKANLLAESANVAKQGVLLDKQALNVEAETQLKGQQKLNLIADALNIPKQGLLIDAQKDTQVAQKGQIDAQALLIAQQKTNLVAEALNIPKQGLLIDANKAHVTQQTTNLVSQNDLLVQQKANAILEGTVLVAQECKLRAEYDFVLSNTQKSQQETALLGQKVITERAQTTALGVDDNSVVGRQKLLYQAQTNGFVRDAEQKTADLMIKSWMTRRTTDDATVADSTNKLNDSFVGRAVDKLLSGVGA